MGWHAMELSRDRLLLFSVTYEKNCLAAGVPFPIAPPKEDFAAAENEEKNHHGYRKQ
jgi:hypothetical protein